MEVEGVGADVLAFQVEVLSSLPSFWGERDVRHLHHPVWFRQFGQSALAVRDGDGSLYGYLLGAPTPVGGYVHVVATLPRARGRHLGRALYARFAAVVAAGGGTTLEAITVPTNAASVEFHRRLGFRATRVEDYAGPGEDRIHFAVDLRTLLGPPVADEHQPQPGRAGPRSAGG